MTREWKEPPGSTRIGSTLWDSSWPGFAGEEDRSELLGLLEKRFGIEEALFDEYALLECGSSWWLIRRSPHLLSAGAFKVFAYGLKAFQRVGRFVKPTTRLIQLFGAAASRSIFTLNEAELQSLLEGKGLETREELEDGYVLLKLENGYIVGLGLLIRGIVHSQIRKRDLPLHR